MDLGVYRVNTGGEVIIHSGWSTMEIHTLGAICLNQFTYGGKKPETPEETLMDAERTGRELAHRQ